MDGISPLLHGLLRALISPAVSHSFADPPSDAAHSKRTVLADISARKEPTGDGSTLLLPSWPRKRRHVFTLLPLDLQVLTSPPRPSAAVAFGVSSKKSLNKAVPLSFNFGLWGISTVTAWFTIKEVGASIDYQYEPEQERERDVAVVQT